MTIELAPEAALKKVAALSGKTRDELATAAFNSYAAWYQFELNNSKNRSKLRIVVK